jgi:DNA-binding MarR family transcriptional regulator
MEPADDLPALAAEIRRCSAIITKIARQDLEEQLARSASGIRALEHGVLRWLSAGACTLSDLSRAMQAPPSTLVLVIDELERKGLVERGRDPRDRRRTPLALTEQGRELLEHLAKLDWQSVLVRSLQALPPEQRLQLHTLLRLFVARVEACATQHGQDALNGSDG